MDEVVAEFNSWDTFQQLDALSSLDAITAAAILATMQPTERTELLARLEPYVAANVIQVHIVEVLG